ncbi:hypothetical protein SLEP1_g41949 [Rubroshorea leprosula]|uniref:Uncharacterized protein n=1 Tax=Rubroshorea leprosula TaxID=152421 RepID=A0AAV5L9J2_9ROSI|nr:hypothetical protein SLEP1_g41949 [Rubroshorea leprosula]
MRKVPPSFLRMRIPSAWTSVIQMEMDVCFRTRSSEMDELANAIGIRRFGFNSRKIVNPSIAPGALTEQVFRNTYLVDTQHAEQGKDATALDEWVFSKNAIGMSIKIALITPIKAQLWISSILTDFTHVLKWITIIILPLHSPFSLVFSITEEGILSMCFMGSDERDLATSEANFPPRKINFPLGTKTAAVILTKFTHKSALHADSKRISGSPMWFVLSNLGTGLVKGGITLYLWTTVRGSQDR